MKIIHCADVHLDSKMSANLSKEKAKNRKAELLTTFQDMVKYGVKNGVEAILIAGDLFDTKNVSASAKNLVRDMICNHPQIKFYYLQGNHDEGSFLSTLQEVPENLYTFDSTWVSHAVDNEGKIVITGVELDSENSGSIYNALSLDARKINIVTLHGQEAEYKAKDKAEVINLNGLKNKGIDYLALGHVHARKEEKLDARGTYCYPGCLEGRGFDECGEHGFMLLDIDAEAGTIEKTFVPIACRNLYTILVDITGCTTSTDILAKMQQCVRECGYSERSLIKFELTGYVDVESEKETDYLLKQFENDFYYVKIKDSSEYKVDYSAFELDMSLKGEFIRTVKAQSDLTEEEKATIIHYGMQALAGEEIIEA